MEFGVFEEVRRESESFLKFMNPVDIYEEERRRGRA
jgi:hypothetical protein